MSVVAVVPVKDFALAKLRLRGVLDTPDCTALAEAMARDVLHAVTRARRVDRCIVVGGEDARQLAAAFDCGFCDDTGCDSLSAAVTRATQLCAGNDTLLVLPADLPTLRDADIDQLLLRFTGGLSLCPANRDGGTNALVISPPDGIDFRYGPDSARLHLEAAARAGLDARREELATFGRDIDTPEDLQRIAQLRVGPATRAWLKRDAGTLAGVAAVGR